MNVARGLCAKSSCFLLVPYATTFGSCFTTFTISAAASMPPHLLVLIGNLAFLLTMFENQLPRIYFGSSTPLGNVALDKRLEASYHLAISDF